MEAVLYHHLRDLLGEIDYEQSCYISLMSALNKLIPHLLAGGEPRDSSPGKWKTPRVKSSTPKRGLSPDPIPGDISAVEQAATGEDEVALPTPSEHDLAMSSAQKEAIFQALSAPPWNPTKSKVQTSLEIINHQMGGRRYQADTRHQPSQTYASTKHVCVT